VPKNLQVSGIFEIAHQRKKQHMIDYFVQRGFKYPNYYIGLLLTNWQCPHGDHYPVLERMHANGFNLDTPRPDGWTIFMLAAANNRIDMVKWILDHAKEQININRQDKNGWTALMGAASKGNSMKFLIDDLNADQTIVNNNGKTAKDISDDLYPKNRQAKFVDFYNYPKYPKYY
jgi:ankyrin repeat protein